jgi:N-acetylmuramoyl-L-alanine amidase
MVSDYIQKPQTFFCLFLIITAVCVFTPRQASACDVKVLLNNSACIHDHKHMKSTSRQQIMDILGRPGRGGKKVTRVVIDAGHGGSDPGAKGKNSVEKEITLSIALKLGDMIRSRFPDVEVFQTRTTDVFIPLFRRIQFANEQNADLFISVHCNFISNTRTRGTETFVMGLHRADDNLEVAKRENASILLEQNYEANYEGYDPNSPEGHIMLSMYQNNYLDKSIEFAAAVEREFGSHMLSKSRGVKQAGFAVLRRASMPAVLVESGFLSNDTDEAFLVSQEGQSQVAESVTRAFAGFYENNLTKQVQEVAGGSPALRNGPVFQVQIAALKGERADMNTPELAAIGTLLILKNGDFNKYMVGDFLSRESAEVAREKLRNIGYKGAFIVAVGE